MKNRIARFLRLLGFLRFDLLTENTPAFPAGAQIPPGKLLVVCDGQIEKWACLSCPGGCGKAISLSLNPGRRPRWNVIRDFWHRPTVRPSVDQLNDCGCHFWIKQGRVDWCANGRPKFQPNPGESADKVSTAPTYRNRMN
ncbi:DUF6527 family protein [Chelatococcus sp. GCM10030263]|uniref:DUF6527 family protein n=1 Tax=Chelatococcus sp. GCM10030263 TaxID=3273387 RepID=UPI00360C3576